MFLGVDIQGSPRSFLVVFWSHKLLASAQLLVVNHFRAAPKSQDFFWLGASFSFLAFFLPFWKNFFRMARDAVFDNDSILEAVFGGFFVTGMFLLQVLQFLEFRVNPRDIGGRVDCEI